MGIQSKIIGGMFGLEADAPAGSPPPSALPLALALPHRLFATGRGALHAILATARPQQVWFPSFFCPCMLQSVPAGSSVIRFFSIGEALHLADEAWLDDVRPGDVVVFIDYFGFSTWSEIGARAKARGAIVVEDAAQGFLSGHFSPVADFLICSPRKFLGVPDGGVLAARAHPALPPVSLSPPPEEWWQGAWRAATLRRDFDQAGGPRTWFELFQHAEANSPAANTAMSDLSRRILFGSIDYAAVRARRRGNYRLLASALGEFALFPELPPETVPLGFPVRVPERDRVRQELFAAEIFPPVHWPIQGVVPDQFSASHVLAREIMTLPCDQRYDESDMQRLSTCFVQALLSSPRASAPAAR
jgi:hypothetical protein